MIMSTAHSERSPVHVLPHCVHSGTPARHPSNPRQAPCARRSGANAPAPVRSRIPPRSRAPVRSRSAPLTCVLTCSSVLIIPPRFTFPPIPPLPLQIRHSYTHCPCNPGAPRRAALREHSEFPQVSSMIKANSDIRDNALTCTFNSSLYRFRA